MGLSDIRFRQTGFEPLITEFGFDLFHPQRIAIVTLWQLHYKMPVIRQQYVGEKCEWMTTANRSNRSAKENASVIAGKYRTTSVQNDRKEQRPARNEPASIVRHHNSLALREYILAFLWQP
jgi:hypothetical protein